MKAIITGATKGIGRSIAEKLAGKGVDLAICSRNIDELHQMKLAFNKKYPETKVFIMEADVSKKEQVDRFAHFAITHLQNIDILINNAGMFIPGSCHEEADGSLEKMIETNLYSAYYLTKNIIPNMKKNRSGHIFNMCSIASITAYDNGGSYSISKYALYGFTKNLREELKEDKIKVTAILPGATWSASWEGVDLPKERLMESDDIAKLVWTALEMSPSATIEDIVIRPQLGDL